VSTTHVIPNITTLFIKTVHITWQQAFYYPKAINIHGINQSCSSSKYCIFKYSSKHHANHL